MAKAYHEAGHAVVGHLTGGRVEWLSLRDAGDGTPGGCVSIVPAMDPRAVAGIDWFANATSKLAGPIAEAMRVATAALGNAALRRLLQAERGHAESGAQQDYHSGQPPQLELDRLGTTEEAFMWRAARRARWLLHLRWPAVEAVRRASMQRDARGHLSGERVRALIAAA